MYVNQTPSTADNCTNKRNLRRENTIRSILICAVMPANLIDFFRVWELKGEGGRGRERERERVREGEKGDK